MISEDQKQECLEAAPLADLSRHPDSMGDHEDSHDGCEADAIQAFLWKASPNLLGKYHSYQERLGYPLA